MAGYKTNFRKAVRLRKLQSKNRMMGSCIPVESYEKRIQEKQQASEKGTHPMQNYTWIIDKDHIADPDAKPGTNGNAIGMFGPRDYSPDLLKALMRGDGIPFRMLDDDKNLYYEGRIAVPKGEEDGEALLCPLDDFGMPNAGCTIIQYKDKTGKWKGIN